MRVEAHRRRYVDATEHQGVALDQAMNVVPRPDSERRLHPFTVDLTGDRQSPRLLIPALLDQVPGFDPAMRPVSPLRCGSRCLMLGNPTSSWGQPRPVRSATQSFDRIGFPGGYSKSTTPTSWNPALRQVALDAG